MTDKEIQQAVQRELDWEPQVTSTEIGVAVEDGVVTLSGFVENNSVRHHAERATQRVIGVRAVANDLAVTPKNGDRSDPDIARAAVQALEAHVSVPCERIKVSVRNGFVRLEGAVDWKYQSDAAEDAVRYLRGVTGVANLIRVWQSFVSTVEVKSQIEEALRRSAELDAQRIRVETTDSTVILRGKVRAWSEREEAERAAWRAPGVTKVENHISVGP